MAMTKGRAYIERPGAGIDRRNHSGPRLARVRKMIQTEQAYDKPAYVWFLIRW